MSGGDEAGELIRRHGRHAGQIVTDRIVAASRADDAQELVRLDRLQKDIARLLEARRG